MPTDANISTTTGGMKKKERIAGEHYCFSGIMAFLLELWLLPIVSQCVSTAELETGLGVRFQLFHSSPA